MNRIAELRKSQKLSQKAFGSIIGVAQNTISNWETEKREPDNESLKKMADYFGVSVDYILGRDEEKPIPKDEDGQCPLEQLFNAFLVQATDETKQALLVLLEQLQKP